MGIAFANGRDGDRQAALEQYDAAMKLFAQQKFERAKALLEKVHDGPWRELSERAQVHLSICNQRLQTAKPALRTGEDHYHYAVLRMNHGHYEEAEEHLEKSRKLEGKTAHGEYAMASLHALRNELDAALAHLREAITLDARYRLLARNDDDFKLLMDDPRFTEELYPEQS